MELEKDSSEGTRLGVVLEKVFDIVHARCETAESTTDVFL